MFSYRNKENNLSVEVYNYPRRCLPRVVDKPHEYAGIAQESLQKLPKLIDEGNGKEEREQRDKIVPPRTGVPLMIRGKGVQVYKFQMAKNVSDIEIRVFCPFSFVFSLRERTWR